MSQDATSLTRWTRRTVVVLLMLSAVSSGAQSADSDAESTPSRSGSQRLASFDASETGSGGSPGSAEPTRGPRAQPSTPSGTSGEPLPPPREQWPLGRAPDASSQAAPGVDGDGVGWFLQTTLALAVVIALILALRFGLKRLSGVSGVGGHADLVEVLARTPIGHKTQVLFLRVNDRIIVAGQTPNGMNTLASLDDPDEVASILARVESSRPSSITDSFARVLSQVDRGFQPPESLRLNEGGDDQEHVVDRARDQVRGLLNRIRSSGRDDQEQRR